MDTKLTLNIDSFVIEQAKEYARSRRVSLSKLIESYLSAIIKKDNREEEITPLVKKLSGVIKLDNDFDYKSMYTDYLMEKYK